MGIPKGAALIWDPALIRGNTVQENTQKIMTRTRFRNKTTDSKNDSDGIAYKKQRN